MAGTPKLVGLPNYRTTQNTIESPANRIGLLRRTRTVTCVGAQRFQPKQFTEMQQFEAPFAAYEKRDCQDSRTNSWSARKRTRSRLGRPTDCARKKRLSVRNLSLLFSTRVVTEFGKEKSENVFSGRMAVRAERRCCLSRHRHCLNEYYLCGCDQLLLRRNSRRGPDVPKSCRPPPRPVGRIS